MKEQEARGRGRKQEKQRTALEWREVSRRPLRNEAGTDVTVSVPVDSFCLIVADLCSEFSLVLLI